ncbi:hypothetical protein AKJ48_02145 [candidate division MSBL1 archaeon SCGC-AAA261O19]|uniref:DOD-type homing endonuclease domain-containing protein n=2 Tax=candidate division MSBL1 TaxID=215777 RepID=A0A133V0E9_9EURY|nr:hypothetical protein AKJ42_02155 [candidate division MSBL1 archaeon SCGC-AAA261C02]KXB04579.1 hypothetical protein AKJ48_02145 [candidate division MSBL1 archaeon SCGC-AAA261O19]
MYRVEASSKPFCEWWNELTYSKVEKLLETNEMKREFIRGFYESEGTLNVPKRKSRRPSIKMATSDEELAKFVKSLLEELGYSPTFSQRKHEWNDRSWVMYHLRLSTSETQKFLKKIGSVIYMKSLSRVESS